MRGCYLCVDDTGKYLFVAGYHDGKITAVHTHQDGRLGQVLTACSTKESEVLQNVTSVHMSAV